MQDSGKTVDVLIGGGGLAGLSLAVALRQALGSGFRVAVADPALNNTARDMRASAIAAAARHLFEAIGVWQQAAQEAQPILDMIVTDSKLGDAVRPVFLNFGGEIEEGEPFAHMIENAPLIAALTDKARETGVELHAQAVTGFERDDGAIRVTLGNGDVIAARLLAAADGARSPNSRTRGDHEPRLVLRTIGHRHDHRA